MRKKEVPMATQDSPNLYERLGGVYSIATVVDDLIDRVMADPRLNANPLVDDAHHKVPPAGFKYLVIEMLCWAAGGPQKYTGKDMESSHRHLHITPGEWRVHGRRGADARQVRSPGGRAGRGRGHRREHPALDRHMSPMLAHRVDSLRCRSWEAIGGEADASRAGRDVRRGKQAAVARVLG